MVVAGENLMSIEDLRRLLSETQIPDTEKLKAITADLQKNFYVFPESVLKLIEIISTSPQNAAVRKQAAIAAARLVPKHWPVLPADQKPVARKVLLETTLQEPDKGCRHSDSRLLANIASLDFDNKEWLDLPATLFNLATSNQVGHREVGSYIIFCLIEADPTHFTDDVVKLFELFAQNLRDPESAEVRINAMQSIGSVLMVVDAEEDERALSAIQSLIPAMVDVLKDAVQQGDEEKVSQAFEVFGSFLAYDSAFLSQHLRDLIQLMMEIGINTSADEDVRVQALNFLSQCAHYRRMKIQGMRDMGSFLTLKAMEVLVEIDDGEDQDEQTPARSALALIDQLASDLPPRQVIVPLLEAFPKFASSDDAGHRKAAILGLGTCAEGAPDFIATQLKGIIPIVLQLLNDHEVGVRYAALIGLSRLAEDMPDELANDHEALIAAVLKNLQAATTENATEEVAAKNIEIIRMACISLDAMASGFQTDKITKFGPQLVSLVGELLAHADYKVKTAAAAALGALAQAMGSEFKPYYQQTMTAFGAYVLIKDNEDEVNLRCAVCDAMGRIAAAVGRDEFRPYVVDLMKASVDALELDNARLRETSFMLWGTLAKVYGTEFQQFLEVVFKNLFDSLELDEQDLTIDMSPEEQAMIEENHVIAAGKKIKVRSSADAAMDDEDDEAWEDVLGANDGSFEKEVALEMLGDVIANACAGEDVAKYLEKAVEMVTPLVEHTYEGCRKSAITTLWQAYGRVWQLWEEESGTKWEPGFPPKQAPNGTLVKLGEIIAKATLSTWPEESERDVVTEINRSLASVFKACGPAILAQEDMLQQTVTLLGTIITRSHPCQQDLGDDEDEQEVEGSSEYDWLVVDTALDVVIGLAVALGPNFGELWKVFEKPILKYAGSTEAIERSTAVGVIAECAANMGNAVTPYTEKLMAILLRRVSDEDRETKSNASYAIGQVIYNSTASNVYLPSYETILAKLEPMLQIRESRILDNAAGCVCRMILAHPDRVPVDEVVPALVALLPLKEDWEENKPVFECVAKLYEHQEPTIMGLTPKLLPVFEQVLGPPEEQLEPETRSLVCQVVQMLYRARPELFQGHQQLVQLAGTA